MASSTTTHDRPSSSSRVYALILLAYLAAVAGFHRDFARLHVPTGIVPIFTGEAAIIVLFAAQVLAVLRAGILPFRLRLADVLLIFYILVATVFAARGLAQGYGLAALRDFALVYYAAFYFFMRAYLAAGHNPLGPVWAISLGATAGSAWQAVKFLSSPALVDGHGGPAYPGLIAWIALVGLIHLQRSVRSPVLRLWLWIAVAIDAFAVYLTAYRTLIGVAAAGLILLAAGRMLWAKAAVTAVLPRLATVLLALGLAIAVHLAVMPGLSSRLTVSGPVSLSDGLGAISSRWSFRTLQPEPAEHPASSDLQEHVEGWRPPVPRLSGSLTASYVFRARAWNNALARIERSPITGIGFGPAPELFPEWLCELPSGPLSNCGNAHNTYLTLAMRMGIPVLFLFIAINAVIFWRFATRLRATGLDHSIQLLGSFSGVAYVSCLAFALLSLFFESPYLSIIYWVVLGCIAAVAETPEAIPAGKPSP